MNHSGLLVITHGKLENVHTFYGGLYKNNHPKKMGDVLFLGI